MKLTIEVSDELINNLLVSGADAGIAYWASFINLKNRTVTDRDSGEVLKLSIKRGIELMVNKYGRFLDPKNLDASTGDVFIQLAAFGEIKYG